MAQVRATHMLSVLALVMAGLSFVMNTQPARPALSKGYSLLQSAGVLEPAAANSPNAPNANVNVFNYQGILRKADGTLASGTYTMTFGLYSLPAGNNNLGYTEDIGGVVVRDGIFNVLLGDKVAIADSVIAQPQLYLGLRVHPDVEMAPRQRIHAVPRALIAHNAYSANTLAPNSTVNGGVNVNGGANINGGLRLAGGANLQGAGILIQNPNWTGFEVQNTAWDGFHVNGATKSGLASLNAEFGVYTTGSRDVGVFVDGSALDGLWVQGAPNWAGTFLGKVQITDICQGCTLAIYGQNSGQTALKPGDIVTFRSTTSKLSFQDQPALGVDIASTQDSIIGVVYGRADMRHVKRGDTEVEILVPAESPAKPGDFVSIITHGIARVRLPVANNVQAGNLLTVSPLFGTAQSLQSNVTSTSTVYGSIVGTALTTPKSGDELVWVFVNPR